MTPEVKRRIYQSYALADRASGRLAGAFEACMSLARDEFPIKKAETLLNQGKGHLIAAAVEPLLARAGKRFNEFSYDEYARAKIIEAVNSEEVTGKIKRDLAKAARKGNDYSRWGVRNEKSIKHHIKNRGRLIREITEDQRKAIFAVIDRMQGENPRVVARQIKETLGLTAHQSKIVMNYRRELQTGGKALRQGMARKLRDKRADASIKRYLAAEKPLPEEKVDSLVDRYRKNWRRHRAETIARTEAMSAINAGQGDVWEEMVEKGEVPKDRVRKFWVATRDVRTRPSHAMTPKLNAEGRAINETFITGLGNRMKHPGDMTAPAADVCNCRCTQIFRPVTSTGQGTRPGKAGDAGLGISGQVSGGGSRYGLGPSGVPTKSISIGPKDLPAPMEGVPFKARSAIGDVLNRRTKGKLPNFNPRRIRRAEPPDVNIGAELAYDIPLEGSFAVVEGNEARIRNRKNIDYDYLISLLDASALLGAPADELASGAYDLNGRRLA